LLVDDEYFDQVQTIESDLTEAYISGGLLGRDRQRFENYFMAAPERRASVKYSKEIRNYFLEKIESQSQLERAHRKPRDWSSGRLRALIRMPNLETRASLAGIIILMVIGKLMLWSAYQGWSNKSAPDEAAQSQRQQEQSQNKIENKQTTPGEPPLGQSQISPEWQKPSKPENAKLPGYKYAKAGVISLELLPGQTMGGDLRSVKLPAKSQLLRLILHSEDDRHQNFRVELRTDEDGKIWSRNDLKLRGSRTDRVIEAEIPTKVLNRKEYKVIVSAKADGGSYD